MRTTGKSVLCLIVTFCVSQILVEATSLQRDEVRLKLMRTSFTTEYQGLLNANKYIEKIKKLSEELEEGKDTEKRQKIITHQAEALSEIQELTDDFRSCLERIREKINADKSSRQKRNKKIENMLFYKKRFGVCKDKINEFLQAVFDDFEKLIKLNSQENGGRDYVFLESDEYKDSEKDLRENRRRQYPTRVKSKYNRFHGANDFCNGTPKCYGVRDSSSSGSESKEHVLASLERHFQRNERTTTNKFYPGRQSQAQKKKILKQLNPFRNKKRAKNQSRHRESKILSAKDHNHFPNVAHLKLKFGRPQSKNTKDGRYTDFVSVDDNSEENRRKGSFIEINAKGNIMENTVHLQKQNSKPKTLDIKLRNYVSDDEKYENTSKSSAFELLKKPNEKSGPETYDKQEEQESSNYEFQERTYPEYEISDENNEKKPTLGGYLKNTNSTQKNKKSKKQNEYQSEENYDEESYSDEGMRQKHKKQNEYKSEENYDEESYSDEGMRQKHKKQNDYKSEEYYEESYIDKDIAENSEENDKYGTHNYTGPESGQKDNKYDDLLSKYSGSKEAYHDAYGTVTAKKNNQKPKKVNLKEKQDKLGSRWNTSVIMAEKKRNDEPEESDEVVHDVRKPVIANKNNHLTNTTDMKMGFDVDGSLHLKNNEDPFEEEPKGFEESEDVPHADDKLVSANKNNHSSNMANATLKFDKAASRKFGISRKFLLRKPDEYEPNEVYSRSAITGNINHFSNTANFNMKFVEPASHNPREKKFKRPVYKKPRRKEDLIYGGYKNRNKYINRNTHRGDGRTFRMPRERMYHKTQYGSSAQMSIESTGGRHAKSRNEERKAKQTGTIVSSADNNKLVNIVNIHMKPNEPVLVKDKEILEVIETLLTDTELVQKFLLNEVNQMIDKINTETYNIEMGKSEQLQQLFELTKYETLKKMNEEVKQAKTCINNQNNKIFYLVANQKSLQEIISVRQEYKQGVMRCANDCRNTLLILTKNHSYQINLILSKTHTMKQPTFTMRNPLKDVIAHIMNKKISLMTKIRNMLEINDPLPTNLPPLRKMLSKTKNKSSLLDIVK